MFKRSSIFKLSPLGTTNSIVCDYTNRSKDGVTGVSGTLGIRFGPNMQVKGRTQNVTKFKTPQERHRGQLTRNTTYNVRNEKLQTESNNTRIKHRRIN